MNEKVHRLIVKAVMTRMPDSREQVEDFFIGFDGCDRPYLLLPTPSELGEDMIFTIRLIGDRTNKYRFRPDTNFTRIPFRRLRYFFDDKTFFFGPEENMLERLLEGEIYETYREWIHNLCDPRKKRKQIS
ncbi:MAG TPA: hypothetical protein VFK44_05070 [Bacillales bacterium]|nr:hypothetical protein [Bacillales bacterium]